ncbi:hypothetical protein O181_001308 [Austropuccinia psidii MF-1]|uniref:Uncharacterized protein n=1 Tax=Austropuccinia psidii MF-1 TaxID=1389203 RepID=A0A9Q3BAI5_9BASI|nr:hypothetical protein [Austropuccinia psidii MF-1]
MTLCRNTRGYGCLSHVIAVLIKLHNTDGFSHVYRLESKTWSNEASIEIEPIAKYDTGGCRLTCLAAAAVVNQSDRDLKETSASNAQCTSEDEESGIDLDASGQPLNLESSDHTDSEQNE